MGDGAVGGVVKWAARWWFAWTVAGVFGLCLGGALRPDMPVLFRALAGGCAVLLATIYFREASRACRPPLPIVPARTPSSAGHNEVSRHATRTEGE